MDSNTSKKRISKSNDAHENKKAKNEELKKVCIYCNVARVCKIPNCWRNIIGIDDEHKGICFSCAMDKYGTDTLKDEQQPPFYIVNKTRINEHFKIPLKYLKDKEEHSWNLGCKGHYYLVKRDDGEVHICCFNSRRF